MKLFLAPMEGVTDWIMRDLLTQLGGIDQCVTEFLRVTDVLYPDSVFFQNCPELKTNSQTRSGVSVFIQLLGGRAEPLAMNAQRAVQLGAKGIDLNFGCPAKVVNRHDGGAALLKNSHRLYDIVKTVRQSVDSQIPVTVKIRLGYDDPSSCIENALAIQEAGASWLTVHCRTKMDGYKPPAHWQWIPKIKESVSMKIVANGDIATVEDFARCKEVTQCEDFMIGRAALTNPYLFQQIKKTQVSELSQQQSWLKIKVLLIPFYEACAVAINEYFATARTKQWLRSLSLKNEEAQFVFEQIKIIKTPREFKDRLIQMIV